jgi:hypothetical protein
MCNTDESNPWSLIGGICDPVCQVSLGQQSQTRPELLRVVANTNQQHCNPGRNHGHARTYVCMHD